MFASNIIRIEKNLNTDNKFKNVKIFFKGCSLNCSWCGSPENKFFSREILRNKDICKNCGKCNNIWEKPRDYITEMNKDPNFKLTEEIVESCKNNALFVMGETYDIDKIIIEIEEYLEKNSPRSLSVDLCGGEVLSNIDLIEGVSEYCSYRNIFITTDTCGHIPFEHFERIIGKIDIFKYRLRIMDDYLHKKYTGVSNKLLLENLKKLSLTSNITLKIPIIKDVNDSDSNFEKIISFVSKLNINDIEIAPYQSICDEYNVYSPSESKIETVLKLFSKNFKNVKLTFSENCK